MTPVDQTRFGAGAGNCLAACIASLLDLSIDQVFNIPAGGKDPDYWCRKTCQQPRRRPSRIPWGSHYMAWGPSARGLEHSVVYSKGQLAHDPHPDRTGLIKVKQVAFLVRLT